LPLDSGRSSARSSRSSFRSSTNNAARAVDLAVLPPPRRACRPPPDASAFKVHFTSHLHTSLILSEFFPRLTRKPSKTPQLNVTRCQNPELFELSIITSYDFNPFLVQSPFVPLRRRVSFMFVTTMMFVPQSAVACLTLRRGDVAGTRTRNTMTQSPARSHGT
jgi:hypothetical protein